MRSRFGDVAFLTRLFWALAILSIAIWAFIPGYVDGWDVNVYRAAIDSLRLGHNPYADAMAVQRAYQSNPLAYAGAPIPYSYVYSPITLVLMRIIAHVPLVLSAIVYWAAYIVAAAVTIWLGMRFLEPEERAPVGLLATMVIFFPGMLYNDALFCGNVAYLLYAAVFCAALYGWRQGRWKWFYAAVLVAGCFKAPMLSLLAIPVLSARRQWLPAAATGVVGLCLFAMQPHVWPQLFHDYMLAVQLQFDYNRDFSSSPAGLIANALFTVAPYKVTSAVAYLSYGAVVVVVLFYYSRKFLAGRLSLTQWVPVLLVGVLLLNPRIMEYDIAPITLPMVLITWRFFARGRTVLQTSFWMAGFFATINLLAAQNHSGLTNPPWKLTAGCTMVAVFAMGVWTLHRALRDSEVKTAIRGEREESTSPQLAMARSL